MGRARNHQESLNDLRCTEPVILLGMHRSGTSLTTRLLVDLGFHMGHSLSRDAEAVFFQRLNRRIFSAANVKWGQVDTLIEMMDSEAFLEHQTRSVERWLLKDRFLLSRGVGVEQFFGPELWKRIQDHPLDAWGWKDPRTTLTFPIWARVFPRARFVHVLRNGIDVAISTHRRSLKQQRKLRNRLFPLDYSPATLDFDYCFHLWETYVRFILHHKDLIADENYLEIRYESLLQNPRSTLEEVLSFLGRRVPEERLEAACRRIDTTRLDNFEHAAERAERITVLSGSPLMRQLGYTYPMKG
jgi:hypothetical protein